MTLRAPALSLAPRARVLEVAERPFVDAAALVTQCPHGIYVGRLARTLSVDLSLSWDRMAAQAGRLPAMPPMTSALLAARIRLFGPLPWIATLCGFVVIGADLTGFDEGRDGQAEFRLRPPGPWFEVVERRWFPTGPGGRSWATWDPPLPPAASARSGSARSGSARF